MWYHSFTPCTVLLMTITLCILFIYILPMKLPVQYNLHNFDLNIILYSTRKNTCTHLSNCPFLYTLMKELHSVPDVIILPFYSDESDDTKLSLPFLPNQFVCITCFLTNLMGANYSKMAERHHAYVVCMFGWFPHIQFPLFRNRLFINALSFKVT